MAATTYVSKQAVTAQTVEAAHIRLGNLIRTLPKFGMRLAAPGVVVRADNFIEITIDGTGSVPLSKIDQMGLEPKV